MIFLNTAQSTITLTYLIYFQSHRTPTIGQLRKLYRSWVEQHTGGVLQASLRCGIDQMPTLEVGPPEDYPAPCPCSCCQDCVEVTWRSKMANHVCLVEQEYRPGWPHAGYWSVLGAASAVARAFDGMIIEPAASLKIRPFAGRSEGSLEVLDHLFVICSVDRRRHGWATTHGLARWGFRELEFNEIPPSLLGDVGSLLTPLAGRILALPDPLPEEIDFQPPGATGSTRIRLVPGDTFTSLRPPASSRTKLLKRWYEKLLTELYGPRE